MTEDDKAQAINTVMDILFTHEDDLSDGFFYYLPIDYDAETEETEADDLQRLALWRICQEIVEAVITTL